MMFALYDEQERRSAELATDRGGSRFEASSACAPRMEAHRVAFESNPTPAAGMGGLSMFTRPSLFQLAVVLLSIWPAAVHCADATAGPSAGKLRASADQAFANGDLDNAVKFLSQAIQLEPENEKNHYKRYRAYLRGKRYREALQDLSMSIQLDPDNAQKIQQRIKLYKMMGRCTDAVDDFGRLQKLQAPLDGMEEARNCMFSLDQAEKLMAVGHWHEARHHLEQAAAVTEAAPDLMYKKAVCAFELRDFYGVAADTGRAIKLDSGNLLALELRAKAYYHLGEYDMAQTHYREALKFDPEHKGCKDGYRQLKKKLKSVEKGQAALDRGQAQEAIEYFHDAIKVDPAHAVFNGPVLVKVARAHLHLKETAKAKETAEKALEHDGRLVEGYLVLSDVLQAMDDFEEAVRVLRRGHEALPEEKRLEEAIQKAEIALKQSKEVNYYKVLGVDRRADTSEIKKAYRTLAKKYHPDKIQDSTPEEKEKAEKEFLKVAEAYEVLSNDDLRARYDRGEDVGSNRQGMQQQGHNPFGFGFPGAGGQQHFTFHFRH